MDTATHFVIGISLAGLAQIDPIVQQEPTLAPAILLGTIIGSQAPDFDGVTRLFGGTANYIRNHRGITHSLPFLVIWPTILSYGIHLYYSNVSFLHLWLWTFFAVFFHVFLDVFNAYGTQALRPLSERWIALNVINIFDPFLFLTHTIGITLWISQLADPKIIFPTVYVITLLYMAWRYMTHHNLIRRLRLEKKLMGKLTVLPTIRRNVWNVIEEQADQYRLGIIRGNSIEWVDQKEKRELHPSITASKQDPKVQNFLYFTRYAYPIYQKVDQGYLVTWIDLRYRFRDRYPFLAIVVLDESLQPVNSFLGWVYNENHLVKKIHSLSQLT